MQDILMSLDGTSCLGKTLDIYDEHASSQDLTAAMTNEVYGLVETTKKEQRYERKIIPCVYEETSYHAY
jgi:hypothetical protein